ncbi:MAG TPA: dihydrolipoyllysine-residue acetyltransferase [Gammaproteobacteria bacterium]|nr:dihydrolipoyllysine-residue acetyltransferase [Gammaproteobacteria bacterium]
MQKDFILPDIGEGIIECEVVKWLVMEGEDIKEDQPVVELMTDKAVVQIPADQAGMVSRLYYAEGEIARVHEPLFALTSHEEHADPVTATEPATASVLGDQQAALASVADSTITGPQTGRSVDAVAPVRSSALASPAVRRICREYKLEITTIHGTGKDGRVLKEDVLAFQEQAAQEQAARGSPGKMDTHQEVTSSKSVRVEAVRGIKAAMARQMTLSAATIPSFTYGDEVDVGRLLVLRKELQGKAQEQGTRLTLMAFFMKAIATAVQHYPLLNSRANEDCSEIHYLPDCNIGMAVDSKVGLLVPNVKRVNTLTILEIAFEVQRLTDCARQGRVSQEDLQGGTISISNIGALGGTYMVPLINPPEVAIVALGKIQQLPRFDEAGQVQKKSLLTLCWSGDHRVIDGGTMARFSTLWQSYLEQPANLLLDLR